MFVKLSAGQGVSLLGSAVSSVALPLTAVIVLHASPFAMGVLAALTTLPHLLFGLVAGILVDRLPRRSILIVTDLGRGLLLGAIPLLALRHGLRMADLYAVAFLVGSMTTVFDTAMTSVVPGLVGSQHLMQANAVVALNGSLAKAAGPTLGGALVQLLSAPLAVTFDALSFLLSALCTFGVRFAPRGGPGREFGLGGILSDAAAGLRALLGQPMLSALAVSATIGALAGSMQGSIVTLYFVRDLHLSAFALGATVTVSGVAAVAGALWASSAGHRFGPGPVYILGQGTTACGGLVLAFARAPLMAAMPFLVVGEVLLGVGPSLYGTAQRSIRQASVPDGLLGRLNATWRFFVFGAHSADADHRVRACRSPDEHKRSRAAQVLGQVIGMERV
jgi:MFS family permease